jgi:hypothetical protein
MIKIAMSGIAGIAIGAYAASHPPAAVSHQIETVKTVSIDTTELTRQAKDLPVAEVIEPF